MNGSRKIEAALVLALAMFSYTAARANAQSAAGADASKKAAAEASPQHDESAEGEKRLKRARSMSPAKRRAATIAAYKAARGR